MVDVLEEKKREILSRGEEPLSIKIPCSVDGKSVR